MPDRYIYVVLHGKPILVYTQWTNYISKHVSLPVTSFGMYSNSISSVHTILHIGGLINTIGMVVLLLNMYVHGAKKCECSEPTLVMANFFYMCISV